jgi:hypothetical protein
MNKLRILFIRLIGFLGLVKDYRDEMPFDDEDGHFVATAGTLENNVRIIRSWRVCFSLREAYYLARYDAWKLRVTRPRTIGVFWDVVQVYHPKTGKADATLEL